MPRRPHRFAFLQPTFSSMIAPTIPREEIYTPDTCRPFPAVESCVTLSAVVVETRDQLKPLDALRMLVTCAVGDGNLALNTNPMPGGRIEPRQVENFRKIGAVAPGQYGRIDLRHPRRAVCRSEWKVRKFNTIATSSVPGRQLGKWINPQRQRHLPAHPPLAYRGGVEGRATRRSRCRRSPRIVKHLADGGRRL